MEDVSGIRGEGGACAEIAERRGGARIPVQEDRARQDRPALAAAEAERAGRRAAARLLAVQALVARLRESRERQEERQNGDHPGERAEERTGGHRLTYTTLATPANRASLRYDATGRSQTRGRHPMPHAATSPFQQALEMIEGLPEEQQQDLVEIVRSRQRERRREALAASIVTARQELARGEARRGSVDDLLADLDE